MNGKPRILYTTPVLKHPPVGGPYLRCENSIIALSQISDLVVYSQIPLSNKNELKFYEKICSKFFVPGSINLWNKVSIQINKLFNHLIHQLISEKVNISIMRPDLNNEIIQIIESFHPDIIWLGYGNISYPLLKFLKEKTKIPIVCDTDSVWSRFILRSIPYIDNETIRKKIRDEGKYKENEEKWGTQVAEITTAVSQVDAEYYHKLAISPNQIQIFSNVINLIDYSIIPEKPINFNKPCLYLAGTFWKKSPMEEAARWMVFEVLPLIKKSFKDVHLMIVGSGSKETLCDIQDPSITITGRVDSVLPYLYYSDVVLVPLKYESGTRFKILEAGACKKPVVSTTLGAEGIPITNYENILIADNPKDFADAIIFLLSNPSFAEKIGLNLYSLIEKDFDIPSLIQEGKHIIKVLIDDNKIK